MVSFPYLGYLFTYFGPLAFVLLVTITKEAYDDYKRYLRDQEANSQIYELITSQGPKHVPSADLKVGDIIRIEKDQKIPADCVLLRSGEENGTCFVRTDQLDGETDWKLRTALPTSQKLADHEILEAHASVFGKVN